MVSDVLTLSEYDFKRELKRRGILKKFHPEELKGVATKNGGVAIVCGDGDIDATSFHRKAISCRPHCKSDFGGPLLLVPSFRGYDACYAGGIIRNIKRGMGVKSTGTIYDYFHYPCGMAKEYHHSLRDIFRMMPESKLILENEGFKKVHTLFHAKRLNKKKEVEQNTYLVDMELLEKFIAEGGLD